MANRATNSKVQPRGRGKSWPLEQWPVCHRLTKKEDSLAKQSRGYYTQIDEINKRLTQTPTRLQFLQEYEPKIFNQNFKLVDGSPLLKNNAEAFGAAWNYFFSPPTGPRNDLTLSYVYMAVHHYERWSCDAADHLQPAQGHEDVFPCTIRRHSRRVA